MAPGRLITALTSEAELPRLVVESLRELSRGYAASLLLVEGDELTFVAGCGDFRQGVLPVGLRLRLGEGITGAAAQSGEPVAVADTLAEPRFHPDDTLPLTRAELAVPVKQRGQVLGVIDIQYKEPRAFAPEEIESLQTLADQLAVAIENARLYDLQRALYDISDATQRASSPEELCSAIHTIVGRLIDAPNMSIAIAEGELIRFPYATGSYDLPPPVRSRGRGLTDLVLRSGETQLVSIERLRRLEEAGEVQRRERRFTAWLGVPLATGSEAFGVLAAQTDRPGGRYGEREVGILTFVSREVAVAIERKRADERLRSAEVQHRQRLQRIIDSMPSIVVGVDPQGRVSEWNVQAERTTGITAAEALGRPLAELMPWLGAQGESLRAALESGQARKERLVRTSGEQTSYLELVVYPLSSAPAEGAVVRIDDVSERVHMDRMLTQAEKMMAVGGIAAGVAHELNNPLGGILQGTQNVIRRLSPELPRNLEVARGCGLDLAAVHAYAEKRQILETLEGIRAAGQRAAAIVSGMLRFARPSERRSEPAELPSLAERMVALAATDFDLGKRYDFRRVEIVRDHAPELPPVPCVATDVELVILNLIKNAAHALCAGSTPSPRIRLSTRLEPPWAVLEVADNGPGMDEPTRARVFEPFFSTKGPGEGTGLGLSVSRFIVVDLHGGQMSVDSAPGRGACFCVRLPLAGRPA